MTPSRTYLCEAFPITSRKFQGSSANGGSSCSLFSAHHFVHCSFHSRLHPLTRVRRSCRPPHCCPRIRQAQCATTAFSSATCHTAEAQAVVSYGMALCSKLPGGPGTATARPAASSLRPAPSSSSPSSRKGATECDRTSAAPALLLLVHARREPASVPVCLLFAGRFGSTQARLKKAILEYAILQGSSCSP